MNSVSLRRATPVDAARLLAWREEPSAGRYQPLRPTTLTSLHERLGKEADHPLDADFEGTATFIIEACGEPTGWITLREVNREHRSGDIGYTMPGTRCFEMTGVRHGKPRHHQIRSRHEQSR